jgi:hypothetical protein
VFLRSTNPKKDGKDHRYFSVVENQRVSGNKIVQWTVLYLGEINDSQQAAWRKTLEVFDEEKQENRNLSLCPDDRALPNDAVDSIQVKLSEMQLRRPRPFGNCWLASELWRQLGLTEFWRETLPAGREVVSWEKVLRLLVVNRLLDPGSEFRVHRHWFVESAMDELLKHDAEVAGKDRLYRCLDRIVEHKQKGIGCGSARIPWAREGVGCPRGGELASERGLSCATLPATVLSGNINVTKVHPNGDYPALSWSSLNRRVFSRSLLKKAPVRQVRSFLDCFVGIREGFCGLAELRRKPRSLGFCLISCV